MYWFSETQVSIEVRSNWGPHSWHLRSRQPSWLILHTVYLGRLYSSSRNNGASMLDLCMESLRDRHSMTMLSQTPQMHCSHLLAWFISQTCLGYILSNFANLSIMHHTYTHLILCLQWVELSGRVRRVRMSHSLYPCIVVYGISLWSCNEQRNDMSIWKFEQNQTIVCHKYMQIYSNYPTRINVSW